MRYVFILLVILTLVPAKVSAQERQLIPNVTVVLPSIVPFPTFGSLSPTPTPTPPSSSIPTQTPTPTSTSTVTQERSTPTPTPTLVEEESPTPTPLSILYVTNSSDDSSPPQPFQTVREAVDTTYRTAVVPPLAFLTRTTAEEFYKDTALPERVSIVLSTLGLVMLIGGIILVFGKEPLIFLIRFSKRFTHTYLYDSQKLFTK